MFFGSNHFHKSICYFIGTLILLFSLALYGKESPRKKEVIRVTGYSYWAWNAPTRASRKAFQHWLNNEKDPATGKFWGEEIELAPDNPLQFPGFSLKLLNFAGGTGEEVITTANDGPQKFFSYRDQRFLLPLNPFIWEIKKNSTGHPLRKSDGQWDYILDKNGKRKLLWKDWENIPDGYKSMVSQGDEVYGLPITQKTSGIIYRKDLFRQAGLNPEKPPANWDELFDFSLKIAALGTKETRKFGFLLDDSVATLFTLGEGSDIVRKYKICDGEKIYAMPDQPLDKAPTGKDISNLKTNWQALYDSQEYINAVKFFRKLTLTRWIISPSHKPIIVWLPDTENQPEIYCEEYGGTGKWNGDPLSKFSKIIFPNAEIGYEDIFKGVVFSEVGGGSQHSEKWYELFFSSEARLGMAIRSATVLEQYGHLLPEQWTFARIPAGKAGAFSRASGKIGALNSAIGKKPELARYAWAVLSFMASNEFRRQEVRTYVNEGIGMAVPPDLLEAEGFKTVAESLPPSLKEYWSTLKFSTKPEIPAKNFAALSALYLAPVLKKATTEENFDYVAALKDANSQIQARLDFDAKIYQTLMYRILFSLAVAGVFLFVGTFSWKAFRALSEIYKDSGPSELSVGIGKKSHRTAYLLLLPALCLITIFNYYPIFAALPIAFQDYYVTGQREWVGLANFIEVFRNADTWFSLLRSLYYLSLSITIGFLAPVVIAVMLSEIKIFQYAFRTAYYLPAVISGIIMLILWQKFLEPTPSGMMNQLVANAVKLYNAIVPSSLHLPPFEAMDFLKSRVLGIPCIVMIHMWGHAGPGTLIYLAALKSIPEDLYEAAEIEGAGWFSRFRNITIAYLAPLLLINFVGAVISSFQKAGEILPLAGNFPATRTFAVQIWSEAFAFCNFGVATALSWLMAALLISFTIWNLKILRRVEFRKASAE